MIRKIKIENFKSILSAELECGNLNIYTGLNASGKSSFLQPLLLLRQSFLFGSLYKTPANLLLSTLDGLVNLGTFQDVLCQIAPKENELISFKLSFDTTSLSFISKKYSTENRDLNVLNGNLEALFSEFENENLFTNNFQYLSADRIQPAEDYPRFQSVELLGKAGEYTAHYIEKHGNEDIQIKELSLKKNPISYSLISQINDWMGEISESIEVITKENLSTNRIELSYRYKQMDGTPSAKYKPQNVGFGITHTLPIIVAILSANKGDIIIIENPETHLHPRGQSRLASLFALAAENGIQLFIETHSDHIINGIRVAVKKERIAKEKVFLNFFAKSPQNISIIKRIGVQLDGGLDNWPLGFFDEWDNLLNELL